MKYRQKFKPALILWTPTGEFLSSTGLRTRSIFKLAVLAAVARFK